jgi:hypothetical protein
VIEIPIDASVVDEKAKKISPAWAGMFARLKQLLYTFVQKTEWTDVSYAGGNFAANGGGTWTVGSGDQAAYRYRMIDRSTMHLIVTLLTTSISGTVSSVTVKVPDGYVGRTPTTQPMTFNDNGTIVTGRCSIVTAGDTVILCVINAGNFSASVNATGIYINFFFEVDPQ